jgi:RND family efflux transporter MFP subunit
LALAFFAALAGCRPRAAEKNAAARPGSAEAAVHLVRPERRTIDYAVEQPGFITAYEQTPIFAKVSGFIQQYYVDIGDGVKKGELLVEIFVPELHEEHQQRVAEVALDEQQVALHRQLVVVAQTNVRTADARLAEAKADVGKYQAEVARWESEVRRLTRMVAEKVVDKEILSEAQKQLAADQAAQDAAQAAVAAREADVATAEANLGKAKIDVLAAQAQVRVAQAAERRAAALLAYTRVAAPYDGVVTVRNANSGDYVQAVAGGQASTDKSAMFVVARTDILRIFVDVPEAYARFVKKGTDAAIRADALSGLQIPAKVTRTSWAIRQATRTLWTEIDLKAGDYDGLRPGMYVATQVLIQRPGVYALPQEALTVSGNQTYCYLLEHGKAKKTPVATGLKAEHWVELDKMKIDGHWAKITGGEQVIVGDLEDLTDGQAVTAAAGPAPSGT